MFWGPLVKNMKNATPLHEFAVQGDRGMSGPSAVQSVVPRQTGVESSKFQALASNGHQL